MFFDLFYSLSPSKLTPVGQYNTESRTHQVGDAVQITAHRQEDDGPFGVGEAL